MYQVMLEMLASRASDYLWSRPHVERIAAAIAEFLLRLPRYYRRVRYLDRRMTPLADGSSAVGEYRGE
jgi:hypothetical protein